MTTDDDRRSRASRSASRSDGKTAALGCALLAGAGLGLAYAADHQTFAQYPEGLAYLFPGLIFCALGFLGVLFLLRAVRAAARKTPMYEQSAYEQSGNDAPRTRRLKPFFILVIAVWCYPALASLVGFPLATLLFQAGALSAVFKRRGLAWLVGAPLAATIAFTVFFNQVLSVPLPRGVGVFYALNALVI